MSTLRCGANVDKSSRHALSIIDSGHITNTLFICFWFSK